MTNSTTRSIEELTLRYARFCERNELDSSIAADEQIAENDKHQLWLDRHLANLAIAQDDENHDYNVSEISNILTDLGRQNEIGQYMLRKGETFITMLNVLPIARKLKNIVAPAPHAISNGVQTKSGFQMSLI